MQSHLEETGTAEPYDGERVDLRIQPSNPNMLTTEKYNALVAGKEAINQAYIAEGINQAEAYANHEVHTSLEITEHALEKMIADVGNYLESVRNAELG